MDKTPHQTLPSSALMREAISSNWSLFMEEIRRAYSNQLEEDLTTNLTKALDIVTGTNIYQLGVRENLVAVWERLRRDTTLTDIYLSTSFKLRGMYNDTGWTEIISGVSKATQMFSGKNTVIDTTTQDRLGKSQLTTSLIEDNQWVVSIVLLSYVDLSHGIPHKEAPRPARSNRE